MNKTIHKTKSDFEVLKKAKFTVDAAELWLPPIQGYDVIFFVDENATAEYYNVPEAELDTALVGFQQLHGEHEMIQVLPSGEERVIS